MAHDAIINRDLDGRIRYRNRGAEVLYGWSKSEAVGRLTHELLQTVFPSAIQGIAKTLRETCYWEGELHQTARSNGTVIVSSRWKVRAEKSKEIEILEINRDITAQRQTEAGFRGLNRELTLRVEELRASEKRFRGLLESVPDATVIVDANGQMVLVNAQTQKQFGYNKEDLLGHSIEMLVPERFCDRRPGHRTLHASKKRVRQIGEDLELFGLRKNGEEFPIEMSFSPIESGGGVLIASTIRDVSERKSLATTLREKDGQVKNADPAEELYLANLTHDLRTPLQIIMALAICCGEN